MPNSIREVHLSSELCRVAEQKYGERFGSLEKFLTFVLQELTRDDTVQMDEAEQHVIEERLKDLGYI